MSEENSIQDNEDVNTGAATPDLEETGDMMAASEVTGSPIRKAVSAQDVVDYPWQAEKEHG